VGASGGPTQVWVNNARLVSSVRMTMLDTNLRNAMVNKVLVISARGFNHHLQDDGCSQNNYFQDSIKMVDMYTPLQGRLKRWNFDMSGDSGSGSASGRIVEPRIFEEAMMMYHHDCEECC